jgi:hypothetical protein
VQAHVGARAADERRQALRLILGTALTLTPKLLKAHLTLPLSGRAPTHIRLSAANAARKSGRFIVHGPLQRFVRRAYYGPGLGALSMAPHLGHEAGFKGTPFIVSRTSLQRGHL